MEDDDLHIHTAVSTPYTSAPSSPGAGPPHSFAGGFFYSAPTSPTHHHHTLSSSNSVSSNPLEGSGGSFEFEFTEATGPAPAGSMTSADELFLNGQIRPMKLSSHLQRPQDPAPLIDVLETDGGGGEGGGGDLDRDLRSRDRSKSIRRRTRSMSPLRTNTAFQWLEEFKDARESTEINEIKEKLEAAEEDNDNDNENENEAPSSGASSRSSSAGRNSKRWVFLKELLLYRSKSEGRNRNHHKLWSALSFSPNSSKKSSSDPDPAISKSSSDSDPAISKSSDPAGPAAISKSSDSDPPISKPPTKKAVNGLGMNRKRRVGRSAHEVHYTAKRAQAEEMRKKTYLPYRQGLLGCLGFSSRSYGAMNGFARALNTVSSR